MKITLEGKEKELSAFLKDFQKQTKNRLFLITYTASNQRMQQWDQI